MKTIFTKEVSIGLITLVAGVLLYVGINYLKGINVFKPTNHYYVLMPNVSELQSSSPVYVDGFKVGIINEIVFDFSGQDHTKVLISLDKAMKIQTGSYAELKTSLTGGAYLDLKLNKYVSTYCQIGDTIDGVSEPGLMDKVSAKLLPQIETILPRLDSILMGLQVLVNHPALSQSLDHIEGATAHLQQSSVQLNALLSKDIPPIVHNLNQVSSDFTVVSSHLKTLDLQATMTTVDKAMLHIDQITQRLNSSDNSLGLLLNDRSLYLHLDSAAYNASNLLLDLKQNPKRYVHFSLFGR